MDRPEAVRAPASGEGRGCHRMMRR